MRWSARWAVVLAVTVGGCGGAGDDPVDAAGGFCQAVTERVRANQARLGEGAARPENVRHTAVVAAINDLPGGMNAFAASDYAAVQHQQFVNLMTLIAYDASGAPVPYLAESWSLSEDGTELTFRLRDDVTWHDGEPTDAEDVAFTYLRVTDPATAYPNASYWDFYVPGREGVEIVDSLTVTIRLAPHADFMDPWRTIAIMPEHLLGDVPPEELVEHPFGTLCPVGNGPFVFVEHRAMDRWVFDANPAFPEGLGGPPGLDRLVYRVIPDETTLLVELLSGSVDVYVAPNPSQVERILEDDGVELLRFPSRNYGFVAWNTRRPALADAGVRRALTLATDREEIVAALLRGMGRVADNAVPPFHWAFQADAPVTAHDPEGARALLEAAGWRDRNADGVREDAQGNPLSVSLKYNQGNQLRKDIAEVMQVQLGEVGVEVVPEEVEWGTLLGQIFDPASRDFDGVVLSWAVDFKLDESGLFHSRSAEEPTGLAGLQDPELDGYLDALQRVVDRGEARGLWARYVSALDAAHPYTFLFFPDRLAGVSRRLRGVRMDARGEWAGVRDWRVGTEPNESP